MVSQLKIVAVTHEVAMELDRAVQTHGMGHSPHESYAVLLEEVDELWAEVKTNPRKNPMRNEHMREEAIQVAAMAVKFVLMLDEALTPVNISGVTQGMRHHQV